MSIQDKKEKLKKLQENLENPKLKEYWGMFEKGIKKLQSEIEAEGSEEEATIDKPMSEAKPKAKPKPRATAKPKPKAQAKTRGRKKTTLSLAEAEKQLAEKVGKTEEECEDIIKQFKELRAKKKARIKKTSETKAKSKAQGKTEKSGEITPEAVIERATEKVESKIEKKIEKVEKKAEETEKPKEKATPQAKKEAEKKVEKKVEKATQKVADESSDALKQMIKAVFDAIKKYDKDKQVGKAELIKLRDEIDKMIASYSDGGMVQGFDIQASLINVGNNPSYAKGGYIEDKELNRELKKGKVFEFNEDEEGYSARVGYEDFYGTKEYYIYFNGAMVHSSKTFGSMLRKLEQLKDDYNLEFAGEEKFGEEEFAEGGIMMDGRLELGSAFGVGGNKSKTYKFIKDDRDSNGKPFYQVIEYPSNSVMAQGEDFQEAYNMFKLFTKGRFAKGGGVDKYVLPKNLKKKLDKVNQYLNKFGGRSLTEKEAIRFNIDNNAQSGFEAGSIAFDLSEAPDEYNGLSWRKASARYYHLIGDSLIEISEQMTNVPYDSYDSEIKKQIKGTEYETYAKGGTLDEVFDDYYGSGGKVRTNSKQVREAVRKHILESVIDEDENEFDNIDDALTYIVEEFKRVADYPINQRRIPNNQERFSDYLMGLPFGFEYYYDDMEKFLNGLGINPEGKKYDADKVQKLYHYLIWREVSPKYYAYAKGGTLDEFFDDYYGSGGGLTEKQKESLRNYGLSEAEIEKADINANIRSMYAETPANPFFNTYAKGGMFSNGGKLDDDYYEPFTFSEKEVKDIADLVAKAIAKIDKVKTEVHDFEYDEGRGAGFDISMDGDKSEGGSYMVRPNGDVVNYAIGNSFRNGVYARIGDKNINQVIKNIKKFDSVNFNYNIGGAIAMLGQAKEVAPETMGSADSYLSNKIKNQQKMDDWWNTPPNQRMAEGGKVSREYATKEIPMSLYKSFFSDSDNDGVPNVDDVEPLNANEKERLEEVSLSDEMKTIINYRNDFEKVRKEVVDDLGNIITECGGKGECTILSRTKTPYSIINKLRRRSLTNVKDLDRLDKEAKNKLKNKELTGLDLYKGLTDVVGTMIVTPDKKNLDKIRDAIKSGKLGEVLEFEDFYANPNNGYRAYHFLISVKKDGVDFPVEVQVRTSRAKKLSDFAHTLYKTDNLNSSGFEKLSKMALESDMGDEKKAKEFDAIISNRNKVMELISKQKMAQGGGVGEVEFGGFLKSGNFDVTLPNGTKYEIEVDKKTGEPKYAIKFGDTHRRSISRMELKPYLNQIYSYAFTKGQSKMAQGGELGNISQPYNIQEGLISVGNNVKFYKKGGRLYDNLKIKKGSFTSKAENRGMTAKAFMKEVLSNPEKYTLKTRRQAQLMKNMKS